MQQQQVHDNASSRRPDRTTPRAGAAVDTTSQPGGDSGTLADRMLTRPVVRDSVEQVVTQVARERASGAFAAADPGPADSPELARLFDRLHETVTRHVDRRRCDGIAVERVLAEVKSLVHEAALGDDRPDRTGVLEGRVIRWSIEAYFDQPELDGVPRFY